MSREYPCIPRILFDTTAALSIGIIGGVPYHYYRRRKRRNTLLGKLNPATVPLAYGAVVKEYYYKLANIKLRRRVFRISRAFGYWGFFFSFYTCLFENIRREDDILNPILAGGGVSGGRGITRRSFNIRGFLKRASTGAFFLFVIEYVITWITPDLHNYLPKNVDHPKDVESYNTFLTRKGRDSTPEQK